MTDVQLGYRRINAGVCLDPNTIKFKDGKQEWNPYFMEHVQDANQLFTDLFKDKIINAVGETGWAVYFLQYNPNTVSWLVDIYVDDESHYRSVVAVIKANIPVDFRLQFFHRGNIATYTQTQ